jgi:outer membrane protein assembly factor BamB
MGETISVRWPIPRFATAAAIFVVSLGLGMADARTLLQPTGDSKEIATAFQINAAHSGSITFQSGFSFPLTKKWTVSFSGFTSYPIIAKGIAFLVVQNSSDRSLQLVALRLADGTQRWSVPLDGSWAAPTYDHGTIIVMSDTGRVAAFNARNGRSTWTDDLGTGYNSPPTAYKGMVFVDGHTSSTEQNTLFALNSATGNQLWTQPGLSDFQDAPTADGDSVYTCDAYRFSAADGAPVWHYNQGCESPGSAPVYFDDRLYVRDVSDGNIVLDANNGVPVESFGASPAPAFFRSNSGDKLGVSLTDGQLFCFSVRTGNVVWSFSGDGQLSSAPIVVNGNVIVGSYSGNLYALDSRKGKVLWSTNVGAAIETPDEWNQEFPLTGIAAGEGVLVVPASDTVSAFAPQ